MATAPSALELAHRYLEGLTHLPEDVRRAMVAAFDRELELVRPSAELSPSGQWRYVLSPQYTALFPPNALRVAVHLCNTLEDLYTFEEGWNVHPSYSTDGVVQCLLMTPNTAITMDPRLEQLLLELPRAMREEVRIQFAQWCHTLRDTARCMTAFEHKHRVMTKNTTPLNYQKVALLSYACQCVQRKLNGLRLVPLVCTVDNQDQVTSIVLVRCSYPVLSDPELDRALDTLPPNRRQFALDALSFVYLPKAQLRVVRWLHSLRRNPNQRRGIYVFDTSARFSAVFQSIRAPVLEVLRRLLTTTFPDIEARVVASEHPYLDVTCSAREPRGFQPTEDTAVQSTPA